MSKEVYHTGAGRMVPAEAICSQCDGDGHIWEGDLLIGDCWLCEGLGYFTDMLPEEDEE